VRACGVVNVGLGVLLVLLLLWWRWGETCASLGCILASLNSAVGLRGMPKTAPARALFRGKIIRSSTANLAAEFQSNLHRSDYNLIRPGNEKSA
jgi:hypothetical protein